MKETIYRNYLPAALAIIGAAAFVERAAFGLAMQAIKVDLSLSDTQLGLLTGIAFALFYSVMGIPIARWADRGDRVLIISLSTVLCSAAVALCGLAGSFLQLLLIRVGVAVGEAGCVPPANSLIAEHFNRAERPRAMAIYMLGGPLCVVVGFLLGGWLIDLYGWRGTFILLGLPGLPLAMLAWFTLMEPRRREQRTARTAGINVLLPRAPDVLPAGLPSLKETCTTLWANITFRHLLIAFSVTSFFSQSITQWEAVFFIRSYGLQSSELGAWFAVIYGFGSLVGIFWGGELASRFAANNERLQLSAIAFVYCCAAIMSAFIYLAPNQYLAFGLKGVVTIGLAMCNAPVLATIQSLVANRMRAMSIAILYLIANFLGLGLGPLFAGALSDALQPMLGGESLRFALMALCPAYLLGGWYLWRASRTVTRDLDAQSEQGALQEGEIALGLSVKPSVHK